MSATVSGGLVAAALPGSCLDGPNRKYNLDGKELTFAHTAVKDSGFKLRESGLLVEGLKAVSRDYDGMRLMIFGDRPEFDEMMAGVQRLEGEINAL